MCALVTSWRVEDDLDPGGFRPKILSYHRKFVANVTPPRREISVSFHTGQKLEAKRGGTEFSIRSTEV